jgi:hypothetical protein
MNSLKAQSKVLSPHEQIRKGRGSSIGWGSIILKGNKLPITLEIATSNFDNNITSKPHQPD